MGNSVGRHTQGHSKHGKGHSKHTHTYKHKKHHYRRRKHGGALFDPAPAVAAVAQPAAPGILASIKEAAANPAALVEKTKGSLTDQIGKLNQVVEGAHNTGINFLKTQQEGLMGQIDNLQNKAANLIKPGAAPAPAPAAGGGRRRKTGSKRKSKKSKTIRKK